MKDKDIPFLVFFSIMSILAFGSVFFNEELWWDSNVYIGMGKFVYSGGDAGLWEDSRPVIWPIILGFFWKIGSGPTLSAQIVSVVFGLGCIFVLYHITLVLTKDRVVSLIASMIFALFPLFFNLMPKALSEIPAAFFLLASLYYLVKNRFPMAGFLLGLSFMTRFFQIFITLGVLFFVFVQWQKKKIDTQKMTSFLGLFALPVLVFLVFNAFVYHDPLHPFRLQAELTISTGEIFEQPWHYYFVYLVKNNALILLAVVGLALLVQRDKKNGLLMLLMLFFGFLPYIFTAHKEMRFLLPLIALFSFLIAYCTFLFGNLEKTKFLFAGILGIAAIINLGLHFETAKKDPRFDFMGQFIEDNKDNEKVWISNPAMIAKHDIKADDLIYYPRYDSKKIGELGKRLDEPDLILLNTCDLLPCPSDDALCPKNHADLLESLQDRFTLRAFRKESQCDYYIYSR